MVLPAAPVALLGKQSPYSLMCTRHPRDSNSNVPTESCCAKGHAMCKTQHSTSAEPQPLTHAAASAGTQATNKPRTQGELVLSACSPSSLCPNIPNLNCAKTTFCESIKYISNHKYIKSSSQENYFKISCLQSSPN